MTTPKTKTPKAAAHPTQAAAPVVEKEELPLAPEPEPEVDMPLPLSENAVYQFKPGVGMSTLDLKEVMLMQMIQLVNGPEVEKGALRSITLQGHRFDQLSDQAQRWFTAVTPPPIAGEVEPKA